MSNEDYTSNEGKRRRDEDDEGEMFTTSKKVFRSPQKPRSSIVKDDKMDQMMEMMQVMIKEMREIREEQRNYQKEMKKLRKENEDIKEENEKLETEIKMINSKLESMDRDKRGNNIVISGLDINDIQQDSVETEMKNFFKKNLEIEPKFKATRKIGVKTYVVELETDSEKLKVMKNKSKLMKIRGEIVYINNDMTKAQREIQRKLRTFGKEEKNAGKNVKEGFQKLIIDNVRYRWNEERGKIEKSQPKN
ncbi:probable inactive protein kinase DDB_G0270444 [Coccinella septempunctata]|uniref:probable inactive protein kinase DDB_G0270444 n=1 Tax=Coccinella septempunctata TaxID=41139 RepID=UPI001D06F963|nr:probable inactive protein kinase DDB_G0270444 [Coccinella septempunctata]